MISLNCSVGNKLKSPKPFDNTHSIETGILMNKKLRLKISFFLILLIIFISLKTINLSADPPNNLSLTSCGEYGDPGNYAFNSRNKVLFGRWKIDDFNIMYISSVPHLFTYLSFLLFGTGIWQMNLVPLFFSILIFITLFLLLYKYLPEAQILFLFLLIINYPFIIYSRIATRIMPMTFFVVLGIFFFLEGWKKPKLFFLSGLFLWLSFISKGKIVYFLVLVIPLSFISIILQKKELLQIKLNLQRLFYFFLGILIIFIPWYFMLYSPNQILFKDFSHNNFQVMIPKTFSKAIVNWFLRPSFSFYHTNKLLTVILFLYFFYLLILLFNKRNKAEVSSLEIICSVWLIVGLFINSIMSYRPIRHYIELTIPMLILFSLFLVRLISNFRFKILLKNKKAFYFLIFLLIWIGVTSYSRKLFSLSEIVNHPYKVIFITIFISFAFLILIYLIFNYFLSDKEMTIYKKFAILTVTIFVSIYSFQNIKEYNYWLRNATFNLKTISRDLGKAFPHSVFGGLLAPSISMENRNEAHTSWPNFVNYDKDFLKEKKVKYLFLGTFNHEPNYYENHFPDEMKKAKIIAKYKIWRSWFLLYEIEDTPSIQQDARFHEAEKMERDIGIPLFDSQASDRFSVFVNFKERGTIGEERIFSPSKKKIKGKLFIKIKEIRRKGPLLALNISKDGNVIYKKAIKVKMNRKDYFNEYKPISFKVFLSGEGDYELKIHSFGNYAFYFDKIELDLEK